MLMATYVVVIEIIAMGIAVFIVMPLIFVSFSMFALRLKRS